MSVPPSRSPRARASRLLLLILAAWTVLGVPAAYGMGKKEDPLREADTLIAGQRYNEAIL